MAAERAVWALGVVAVYVDAQDAVEVAGTKDQHPVQAGRTRVTRPDSSGS